YTTVPSISITLIIFLFAGFWYNGEDAHIAEYTEGLSRTFNISLWTLVVPVITAILIAKKVPSLITLSVSSLVAGICAIILQPHILMQVAGSNIMSVLTLAKGVMMTWYGPTAIETGNATLNDLVSTGGMAGMMNTIWLILCAMCFGGVMTASGMLHSLTLVIMRFIKGVCSLVSATAATGFLLNVTTSDQYISIIVSASMYKDLYKEKGYAPELLSRTTEDSATVTSVLIPWSTCGMTQATVLGVPTIAYLPYCFFNYLSPFMSCFVAAIGWKIKRIRN
ncbi:MAG: sodium:proton antiporter, partial [Bacteroidaceae bacterium]|nr:sodium:proton antiporter [Bacteroidaceae bacterium]